ncbi:BTB/POZ domain-containing protein [Phanerochaete sordida]|uniref:BTB/POZ domain-containing protein n=1 Tax=Phanerochaete sordida TaxID=48140 RepID=A0A9P3L8F8_9APHY|nr:BTB/POZ domain-containing protein [Phanerochaete sordida]
MAAAALEHPTLATLPPKQEPSDVFPNETPVVSTSVGAPHPLFDSPDADIILCSSDAITFRVHSNVLASTSGFFRTLLSLPQCPPSYKRSSSPTLALSPEVVHITESGRVLEGLLSMCTGRELPQLEDFGFVEELLHAAEKYEMPGALSVLRLALTSTTLLDAHPVRVYAIACQWGWKETARVAASRTLGLDLLGHALVKDLTYIESPHLISLLLLHRRRRDVLRQGLDSLVEFYANNQPSRCCNCQKEVVHGEWLSLKLTWLNAIEQRPADIATGAVLQDSQLHKLFSASCPHCQRLLYNPSGTILRLKQLLERLPKTVEF